MYKNTSSFVDNPVYNIVISMGISVSLGADKAGYMIQRNVDKKTTSKTAGITIIKWG